MTKKRPTVQHFTSGGGYLKGLIQVLWVTRQKINLNALKISLF